MAAPRVARLSGVTHWRVCGVALIRVDNTHGGKSRTCVQAMQGYDIWCLGEESKPSEPTELDR